MLFLHHHDLRSSNFLHDSDFSIKLDKHHLYVPLSFGQRLLMFSKLERQEFLLSQFFRQFTTTSVSCIGERLPNFCRNSCTTNTMVIASFSFHFLHLLSKQICCTDPLFSTRSRASRFSKLIKLSATIRKRCLFISALCWL